MNFEELLEAHGSKNAETPFGELRKVPVDNKFVNVVKISKKWNDDFHFQNDKWKEYKEVNSLQHKNLMKYTLADTYLKLENGTLTTLSKQLLEQPAIVADKNFVDDIFSKMVDVATYLHEMGIYHVCFAPSNILIRKNSGEPALLCHGSFYLNVEQAKLYEGVEEFVAPEVMNQGEADARSDVYSLGKMIEAIYAESSMPVEYKKIVKKATQEDPDKRFQTPNDMYSSMKHTRGIKSSAVMFLAAAAVALVIFGIYKMMLPEPSQVEFVKPVPRQGIDDVGMEDIDPTMLGVIDSDTALMTPEEEAQQREYEAKCEEIFRRRYAKEAERVLSKIYNSDYMSSAEQRFMAGNQTTMKELTDLQIKLGGETNLSDAKSQRIAAEIIDRITKEKMDAMRKEKKGMAEDE